MVLGAYDLVHLMSAHLTIRTIKMSLIVKFFTNFSWGFVTLRIQLPQTEILQSDHLLNHPYCRIQTEISLV